MLQEILTELEELADEPRRFSRHQALQLVTKLPGLLRGLIREARHGERFAVYDLLRGHHVARELVRRARCTGLPLPQGLEEEQRRARSLLRRLAGPIKHQTAALFFEPEAADVECAA